MITEIHPKPRRVQNPDMPIRDAVRPFFGVFGAKTTYHPLAPKIGRYTEKAQVEWGEKNIRIFRLINNCKLCRNSAFLRRHILNVDNMFKK